ncbi:hypothetical protein MJH12_04895, partial [bacterium]|nr:hypothetical protein [bacterium]
SRDVIKTSSVYEWSEANKKVYHFARHSSLNDLQYEEINQISGKIDSFGDTPHEREYYIAPPVIVSDNGSKILIGSGEIYNGYTLQHEAKINIRPIDAIWIENKLKTVRVNYSQSGVESIIEDIDEQQLVTSDFKVSGKALKMFKSNTTIVLIVQIEGNPKVLSCSSHSELCL